MESRLGKPKMKVPLTKCYGKATKVSSTIPILQIRQQGLEMLISLPQATNVSDGSGIWLLDICYTCYFLIPLSTKYSKKNIRNRKCLKTCRKFCCTQQISVAQPAAQIPTRQGPFHLQSSYLFPSPSGFSPSGMAQKNKGRSFCILRTFDE